VTKFLAMLKDSYKEAVDGKIFLVLLVLGLLLVLLVGSLSYTPAPADVAIPRMAQRMMQVVPNRGDSLQTRFYAFQSEVKDFETVTPADQPYRGEYRFHVDITNMGILGTVGAEEDEKGNKKAVQGKGIMAEPFKEAVQGWAGSADKPAPYTDELAKEFIRYYFRVNGNLDVTGVEQLPPPPKPKKTKEEKEAEKAKGAGLPFGLGDRDVSARYRVTVKGSGDPRAWPHEVHLFFGALSIPPTFSLGFAIYFIESTLIAGFGAWVLLLTAVVVTAGFVPNMVRKGAVDLLLAKPISRSWLLVYKYVGGLTFVFLLTLFTVGGVWVVIGLRSGIWGTGFLYCILAITFYFAILYAVSTLFGVLTRNALVSIIATVVFWFGPWVVGQIHTGLDMFRNSNDGSLGERIPAWVFKTADAVNAATPRTKDLDNLTSKLISSDLLTEQDMRAARAHLITYPAWGEVIGVSAAYIAVLLGLGCLRFVTRDN
jgi:ABC-type transport system involved in multi-copper enzyme maturation permease subunit